jgi:hypothetical protein
MQRTLPDNIQHSQERDIHDTGGIRTRNPSKPAAADPRLRLQGQWDRAQVLLQTYIRQMQLPKILVKLLYYAEGFFVCTLGLCWSVSRQCLCMSENSWPSHHSRSPSKCFKLRIQKKCSEETSLNNLIMNL